MKQFINKIFVSVALVLALAGFTAAEVWGETVTWQGTTALPGTATSIGTSPIKIKTSSTNTYTNPIRVYANTTVTITADSGYSIQSVTYEASSTGNYVTNAEGATVSPDVTPTVSGKNVTWTLSNVSEFTFKPSAQTRANSISITYTSAGSSSLEDSDLALTSAPVTLNFDLYSSKEAQTVSYTTSSTGAITVSESEYIEATVNSASKTITVTPVKKTPSAQTITVSQAADANYKAGTATFTVSITDSTPFNGAIFDATKDTGDGSISKNGVSFVCTSGVLDNGSEYRLYKNSTTTFSVTDGVIKEIAFTGVSGYPASGFGTQSGWTTDGNNGTWVGSSKSVSFVASGAQVRASKIVVTVDLTGAEDPSISADNVNIAYDATGGSIAFTVNNPVNGGSISASTDANWLTLGNETTSPISFTCDANSENTARTATVTLTYTYDSNKTVTKNVTVTQAAAPVIYSTIPALFAAATSSEESVNVTFDSWIVSGVSTNGKNIYVTDNSGNGFIIYYSSDMSGTYHAGDIISGTNVSCDLVLYNGAAEIKNLDASDVTITSGGTVSVSNIAMVNLAGINSGALVSYSNLTCSISNNKYYLTDGTTTLQLYNQLFAFDALSAGKEYNITGVYLQYNSTKEIMPRSAADIQEIVPIIPTVTPATTSINVVAAGANGTLAVTYDNITDVTADVAFYQSNGTTTATYDWITAYVNNENNVVYQVAANTSSEPRSAYMKVWAYDDNLNEVYSDLITITQNGFVADYATLPFIFDGGRADIENTAGLTQNGLGTSDYTSSPKLKFDSANDCVILKINEAPGVLSFDIKGNPSQGSWSGTFKVQGSSDGVTYTDIQTYSSMSSSKQSETIEHMGSDVRYIKWILVTKDNGNVALGNINLAKVDLTPSITVSSNAINAPATETEGTLNVSYKNIDFTNAPEVFFCTSEGNATTYDWIVASVNSENNVDYLIEANTGAARTAYFKVYGLDSEANDVYSDLVTVFQEEYIPNYATLPFEWDDTSTPQGITNSGVDYYKSSPYLKFDTTGDYIILEFNETPGTLTFAIKGNGSGSDPWAGTFKVQTSTDGVNYTDLETFTELGATQSKEFNLAPNVRFVKWIYTEKVTGNVALGNIKLTALTAGAVSYTLIGKESKGLYWASFYCSEAGYALSEGAQAFTMNASKQLYRLGDGTKIPANTAVVILSETKTITLTKDESASAAVSGGANILQGSDTAAAKPVSGKVYVLGVVEGTLGFYEYTGDKIPAMKAYYTVNE